MSEVIVYVQPRRMRPADRGPRVEVASQVTSAAERNRRRRRATPKWADRRKIERIYAQARAESRRTGVPHHVDHVIPLLHPLVCGLHVETNLRIIPAIDNMTKHNRWWDGAKNIPQGLRYSTVGQKTTSYGKQRNALNKGRK